MPAEEAKKIEPYTAKVKGWMIDAIVRGSRRSEAGPCRLRHKARRVSPSIAASRRPRASSNAANPEGPVDHDVPVLRVETPDGKLRAVVFGYACHNTTLQFYQWCGDYAGFAQTISKRSTRRDGAVLDGLRRRRQSAAAQQGRIVQEVRPRTGRRRRGRVIGRMTPITDDSAAKYATISLPLDKLPGRGRWEAERRASSTPCASVPSGSLKLLDDGGKIDDHYRYYPVQAWRLGELTWVAMGGEVVVDYDLRLKSELGRDRPLWIAGYANDVMAYIPSLRVLKEGGYEADSSMIYYGMPTKWGPTIEEKIVAKVHELVKGVRSDARQRP